MKIKVISNFSGLETACFNNTVIEVHPYPTGRIRIPSILKIFLISFKYDYILFNFAGPDLLILGLFKLLVPFNRCKLVSLDLLLTLPVSLRDRLLCIIKALIFKKVYRFLVYTKNTDGYQRYFRIKPDKFLYVPYKVNALELINKAKVIDGKYVFCGGKSRRDFKTLFNAVRDLPFKVKIVTVVNTDLAKHGSYLDDNNIPENVEIIRHDGSVGLFVEYMANARLVVLPIKKDCITQGGIAVYLMAMALRKCVIISSGPGADDILTENQAIIIPPGDPIALRDAIQKAFTDGTYRKSIAENGYLYASKLGGTDRLRVSVRSWLAHDFSQTGVRRG